MFTAYLQWWDRHPWMIAVVLGIAALVLGWQAYADVRRKRHFTPLEPEGPRWELQRAISRYLLARQADLTETGVTGVSAGLMTGLQKAADEGLESAAAWFLAQADRRA